MAWFELNDLQLNITKPKQQGFQEAEDTPELSHQNMEVDIVEYLYMGVRTNIKLGWTKYQDALCTENSVMYCVIFFWCYYCGSAVRIY